MMITGAGLRYLYPGSYEERGKKMGKKNFIGEEEHYENR